MYDHHNVRPGAERLRWLKNHPNRPLGTDIELCEIIEKGGITETSWIYAERMMDNEHRRYLTTNLAAILWAIAETHEEETAKLIDTVERFIAERCKE